MTWYGDRRGVDCKYSVTGYDIRIQRTSHTGSGVKITSLATHHLFSVESLANKALSM